MESSQLDKEARRWRWRLLQEGRLATVRKLAYRVDSAQASASLHTTTFSPPPSLMKWFRSTSIATRRAGLLSARVGGRSINF
jgi:hypothetical protein